MFRLVQCQDLIRIPPERFGEPFGDIALERLKAKYEGIVTEDLGYIILVTDMEVESIGKIIPGDGATYHRSTFTLLTFYPEIQEIVEGELVEIEDFGAFVRIGPIDALLHVSQIIDDFISYDDRQAVLLGRETRRRLTQGDLVRARITAVSLSKGGASGKIGLTCRQPFLGKLDWIAEDIQKTKGPVPESKEEG